MAGLVPLRFFLLSPRKPLRRVFAGAPLVLPKKMGRARWKKKPLGPNLPVLASLGMRRLIASFPQICPVPSRCAVARLATHAYAASCDASSNSEGACQSVQFLFPLPLRRGWIPKEGAAAPSLCRLKGRSRRGRPKSPSWRVFWTVHGPFSPRGENGGCIARLHQGVILSFCAQL